ncbi:predicted protein [Postia placenta Mad-698-R]|nr:predicted protein [Postia placenta Mad-698-R]
MAYGLLVLASLDLHGILMAILVVHRGKSTSDTSDYVLSTLWSLALSDASTFTVELDEWCGLSISLLSILRDAAPQSFVILDGLGRDISTPDGMAIAGASRPQDGSLTDDLVYPPNVRNMHMKTMVDDEQRELVFLYTLIRAASSSFGAHVASLTEVPSDVIERRHTGVQ